MSRAGLNIKRHPCCYWTHLAADAILELREHGLAADAVDVIDVRVQQGGLAALTEGQPETGLAAKFSMSFVVAAALLDGQLTLNTFTDEGARRPEVRELVGRINCREDPGCRERFAEVTVRTRSGGKVSERVSIARGDSRAPLTQAQLVDKACGCFRHLDGDARRGLAEWLLTAASANTVGELLDAVARYR
ncbi:hypothetical protein ACTWJ8_02335 [Streptomyces sp. SDT5-1]|uniref:hypothetical protein n=1 Tax=Streptomyces sp. SDT5-1 TaxID=3406418 RepID=UPI003FD676CC